MHIPDGFLDPKVWASANVVSAGGLYYAVKKVRSTFDERKVPALGLAAAFIFAAQMINFPVVGGTSGHLIGGALAALLLGPWAAVIVLTTIVAVQALVFLDGGVAVLGANVLNMAIIAPLTGYYVFMLIKRLAPRYPAAGIVIGAWMSVVAAALAGAAQLALSGVVPLAVVLPPMLFWHILIGLAEGLITVAVVRYVLATRPDLVQKEVAVAHE